MHGAWCVAILAQRTAYHTLVTHTCGTIAVSYDLRGNIYVDRYGRLCYDYIVASGSSLILEETEPGIVLAG